MGKVLVLGSGDVEGVEGDIALLLRDHLLQLDLLLEAGWGREEGG